VINLIDKNNLKSMEGSNYDNNQFMFDIYARNKNLIDEKFVEHLEVYKLKEDFFTDTDGVELFKAQKLAKILRIKEERITIWVHLPKRCLRIKNKVE
jgi:hypothetical protein